jgi:hypothetical protein
MPITLDGTLGITTPALTVTGASTYTGDISTAGNLVFTTTGDRIIGDMSNATLANRLMFQTSTANSNSILSVIPSGTATTTAFQAFNNSDPTNASQADFRVSGSSDVRVSSTSAGSGTYLPMTFYTGGSERMRIDTSGNVMIGVTTQQGKLTVVNASAGVTGALLSSNSLAALYVDYLGGGNNYYQSNGTQYWTNFGAGSTWMTLSSTGNLGIGTASPTAPLDITSSTLGYMNLTGGAGNAQGAFIRFRKSTTDIGFFGTSSAVLGNSTSDLIMYADGAANAVFWTNGQERMRITSSGDVQLSTAGTSILNSSGRKMLNQTGGILQVVSGTLNSSATTTSTSFVDTGLSVSITPSSTSSKIYMVINTNTSVSNYTGRIYFRVTGGNAASYIGTGGTGVNCAMAITPRVDGAGYIMHPVSLSYLDSPATTSAITYKLQWYVEKETGWLNRPNTQDGNGANTFSTFTVMEIAG